MGRHSKSFSYVYYKNECLSLESGEVGLVVNEEVFISSFGGKVRTLRSYVSVFYFFCPKDQANWLLNIKNVITLSI